LALFQAYIADFEAYKVAKTSQLNEVEKHSLYLFEYSNALATIIMNFEKGLYPVYEKSGVKAAAIPDKAKPGPMSAEVASKPSSSSHRRKSGPHVCTEATPRLQPYPLHAIHPLICLNKNHETQWSHPSPPLAPRYFDP
jgi:hypothetical protein